VPHVPHISKQTFTRHFAKFSTDNLRFRDARAWRADYRASALPGAPGHQRYTSGVRASPALRCQARRSGARRRVCRVEQELTSGHRIRESRDSGDTPSWATVPAEQSSLCGHGRCEDSGDTSCGLAAAGVRRRPGRPGAKESTPQKTTLAHACGDFRKFNRHR